MLASVTCPTCQYKYLLDEGQMGSRQVCPKCQSTYFAGKSAAETRAVGGPPASAQPSYAKTMIGDAPPPIKYSCPRCKAPLEAEGIEGGTKKNCPNCTQRHQVPDAPKPSVPSPALNRTLLASDESAAPPAPPIKYNCPNCKKPLEAPASQGGTKQNCPSCNQRLQVPAAPAAPNRNKTMLASDESAGSSNNPYGSPSSGGSHGSGPGTSTPANPWAKHATPLNVGLGILLLLLLLFVVPAFIRGGKDVDSEAVAKAKIELEKLKLELEAKKVEMEKQSKADADARKQFEDMMRANRDREDKYRKDEEQRLRNIEDEDRRRAEKRKLDDERKNREAEHNAQLAKIQQLMEESEKKSEKLKRDLEETKNKTQSTQTIIQQPPVIYHPPYHPGYYRPWWW